MNFIDFPQFAEIFGENISEQTYRKFSDYAELLTEWNEKINLTAITDPREIAIKHFFDSVYPFTLFELPQSACVADIGTGAGFPSIPLKIVRNDIELTLIDSLNKRINFLETLLDTLELKARCIHGRAEELAKTADLRESFDIAAARAVAPLDRLCEYCLPFVKVGGKFVALKGSGGGEELEQAENAIKILGGTVNDMIKYTLPDGSERTLIIIEKTAPTPEKYPRNAGQIKKKSL